jgi:hypothetical protein
MSSESARASSAAETRFRIDDANSRQRTVKVVALDSLSEAVVRRLAGAAWGGARFLAAAALAAAPSGDPLTAGEGADLVALVATAGEDLAPACVVGEACRMGQTTIAFVLTGPSTTRDALSRTLARLRPWTLMLTIAEDEDCIGEVLRALRA